jgi:hypothetical protein
VLDGFQVVFDTVLRLLRRQDSVASSEKSLSLPQTQDLSLAALPTRLVAVVHEDRLVLQTAEVVVGGVEVEELTWGVFSPVSV